MEDKMLNWKQLFHETILKRGLQYYKTGKVKNIRKVDASYQADVYGSDIYHVTVGEDDQGENMILDCDCPYAEDGNTCKHMAALCYAIEDIKTLKEANAEDIKKESKKVTDLKNRLFGNNQQDEEYRYFDIDSMVESVKCTAKMLMKAENLVNEKTIELQNVEFSYSNNYREKELIGKAYGIIKQQKQMYSVVIIFDQNEIRQAYCKVPGCSKYYDSITYCHGKISLCEHEMALLICIADYIKKYNPGDSTDADANHMIQSYRAQRILKTIENTKEMSQTLTLEPKLEKKDETLQLSFRVGIDKLYVIKNLKDFVDAVVTHDCMKFGKKTEINFAQHQFDEQSEKYFTFLKQCVLNEIHRSLYRSKSYYFYTEDSEIRSSIPLYGEKLDKFFDVFYQTTMPYTENSYYKQIKTNITLQEKDPKLHFQLEQEMNQQGIFQGVRVLGKFPEIIQGIEYNYYMEETSLNRISKDMAKKMSPFMDMRDGEEKISFLIGRKHLAEFYYTILPEMSKFAQIRVKKKKELEQYLPPEATFQFFLDAEDDKITCQVKALYGEQIESVMDLFHEEIPMPAYRDRFRESEIVYQVQQYFDTPNYTADVFECNREESIYQILEEGVGELLKLGEVNSTDRFRTLNIRRYPKVSIGVSIESDLMNLTISSEEVSMEELLETINSYKKKKKYYRLKNGDFLNIEENELENLKTMIETLHISPKEFVKGKMQIPTYRALYLDKMLEECERFYTTRDKYFKKLIKEFKTVNDSDYEVPQTLRSMMRNYQIFGYRWLRTIEQCGFGGILADDMGLGKTLQMISVLLAAKEENSLGTALVIAPASLVYNWQEEMKRFAPTLLVDTVTGNQAERKEKIENYKCWDVLITSYDLLKRDIAEYENAQFSYQIIDEAQYIKNHTTAVAKAVKVVHSKCRFALTGTPIENRLSELWSIFDYLMSGFLYSYDVFRKELETPITKNKDEIATKKLKRMIAPFILRRLKNDVLKDLPDKLEEVHYAKLEDEQQKLYDGQVTHMLSMLREQSDENYKKDKLKMLAELTKIRQICCDPSLLFENYTGSSAKRNACMELIQNAIEGEHKVLIFSQFTTMLELLEQDLAKNKIGYYKITGATSKEKRLEYVHDFNENNVPVFLISLKAGGTGLNLTGADVVIHYDPWWNLAVQNQATDRAHRLGQTKKVSVYKLIVKDSIEEKILHMQEKKKDLADEILNGENTGLINMSKEDLIQLLE